MQFTRLDDHLWVGRVVDQQYRGGLQAAAYSLKGEWIMAFSSQIASAEIEHDAKEPALKPLRLFQRKKRQIRLRHRLLHPFARRIAVRYHTLGHAHGPGVVTFQQQAKGLLVATRARLFYQIGVRRSFHTT